jgi:branched-chain amino acid transport system ATP-binding protein
MALLEASDICMYFGGVKAVDHLDIAVQDGQILGIIGPNGSGKTTFFNVLTGLYKPTAGRITFMGQEITNHLPHQVARAGIARTFQNIRLFKNTSVLDNVLVGQHLKLNENLFDALMRTSNQKQVEKKARQRAEELLDFVKLYDKVNEFSANLAYGEQRRLEIARALATQPKLLLLDEPTAGMNPGEAVQVINLFHSIRALGITIILIEHNMQVMMGTAEHIIAMAGGKKIAEGTPEQIQYNPQVIQAYLGEEE